VPWVIDGLDVDGVDVSADMIAVCREAASVAGCQPALYVQPTHLLDLPRRYGSIIMCGSLGLGVTRQQDLEGLRRLRAHLRPEGILALDYEVGEFDDDRWSRWQERPADQTAPGEEDRRLAPDGFHYALRGRIVSVDVATGRVTRELQAWQWRDSDLVGHESHTLTVNIYSSDDIVAMLDQAGFVDIRVVGGYHGGAPTGIDEFLVYVASVV
jgi:SAM-dependent methyltransferase